MVQKHKNSSIDFISSSTFYNIACMCVKWVILYLLHWKPHGNIEIPNFEIKMILMFVLRCTVAMSLIRTYKVEGSCSNMWVEWFLTFNGLFIFIISEHNFFNVYFSDHRIFWEVAATTITELVIFVKVLLNKCI